MFTKIKRKHLPIKGLHQCFRLMYFLLYHSGCLGTKVNDGQRLFYDKSFNIYRNIYRFIYLSGLIGGFAYKIYDEELNEAIMSQLSPIIKVILTFECILCPVTYIEITLHLDCSRDTYINLANTFQGLDKQMQQDFKNIQWNYEKTTRKYNLITVALYGFYAIVATIYIFHFAHCACGWTSSAIISFCYACVTGTQALAGFLFVGNVDMLRLRFRLMRKLLRQQISKMHTNPHLNQIKNITVLKLLQKYFKEYSGLIVPVNEVFSVTSSSGLFHDFALITILGYLLCSKAFETNAKVNEYLFISLFMAPRVYKSVTTALYGYATQKERNNCCGEFLKIEYYFKKSAIVHQQMEDFFHWRMHNNYQLTVGRILKCNLTLIFLILSSILNYIMILIQLQFQQNAIANRVINKIELGRKD